MNLQTKKIKTFKIKEINKALKDMKNGKILGRPLSQKTQEGFFRIGMFLLLSLMFFTTFNDLKDLGLFR